MYDFTLFFLYKPIFMAELLVAEIIFTYHLKRRRLFCLWLPLAILACFGFALAVPVFAYDAFGSSFIFILMFAFSLCALKVCYAEPWVNVLFCALAGYSTQHIAYELNDIVLTALGLKETLGLKMYGSSSLLGISPVALSFVNISFVFTFSLTYWLCWAFFARRLRKGEDMRLKNVSLLFLAGLILLTDIFLGAAVIYHSYDAYDPSYLIYFNALNIICCVISLAIQFMLLFRKELEGELETIKRLWHQDEKQYREQRENIELVNIKCHDLKHQIHRIGSMEAIDKNAISEIENVVSIYDSSVKTGSETLDVVLTEKSLFCTKNAIKMTCIADGSKLSFMAASDIYSLFGNAIDNAIDAVMELEPSKRVIGLNVRVSHAFLSINIHNYYRGQLRFEDGLPLTTKQDKKYNGFGMKSIRYICEKYHGSLSVRPEGGIFNLNILFALDVPVTVASQPEAAKPIG